MSLLSCQNVCVSFAQRDVIKNASFEVNKGDRIGLIGVNGSGKTTLFRVICGLLEPSDGTLVKASLTTVGFVEQHACAESRLNVYDELLTVFRPLMELERELEELHRKVELTSGSVPEYLERQEELTRQFQDRGGLTYQSRAHSCLKGLGFTEAEESLPVSALSGGQRTKLSLGKLLLSEPDIMLLDEPTNHLDIASVEWLEDFIGKYGGTLLVISHDRYFLDKTTTRTIEISNRRVICGKGNYSVYMKNKAERLESDRRAYEKGMLEIRRIEKMIEQQKQFNQERNYITIASKEKQIERIRAELPELPPREKTFPLRFGEVVRSGDEVLIAEGLSKAYDGKRLFENVDLRIYRGEKVFLLGPNGCGKSTLLGLILNKIPKDAGYARFGHNVTVGSFEQTQTGLTTDKTVLGELYDRFPTRTVPELRGYLGAFNFKDDDIDKRMRDLSGGERARVALLILILKHPNFLILDEPTNHLDIASREVLEEALLGFEGTILCVSHDRYFVNKLATKILYFNTTEIAALDGNYDDYVTALAAGGNASEGARKAEKKPNEYQLRKEAESRERKRQTRKRRIEEELSSCEERRDELNRTLSDPDTAADYEKILSLTAELEEVNGRIDELEAEWLELEEI
ncbi:MAG: ABC-F family ATP-binding cassette domain-containing protein [Clostridia bacterium]|nr:ABC-F family ATP-binding cassette domain-containing protein [Clostridia bacterium]